MFFEEKKYLFNYFSQKIEIYLKKLLENKNKYKKSLKMKVFVDFQDKLSQTAIFSIKESDYDKHYKGKNGKLLVNLMNYPDKIVISSIFDVFPDENLPKNTIFLPKTIQKYLESQRKSLGNLYANIFSLDPVKIPEFPFEVSLKINQIFHKNTQIREKSLYMAFLKLPELVF